MQWLLDDYTEGKGFTEMIGYPGFEDENGNKKHFNTNEQPKPGEDISSIVELAENDRPADTGQVLLQWCLKVLIERGV